MMIFVLVLSLFSYATPTEVIIVKPGSSRNFERQDWLRYRNQTLTIQCEEEKKCSIGYEYVGKKYSLTMPNGKNYSFYQDKEDAMSAGAKLVSAKICDRLELNVESDEVVARQ